MHVNGEISKECLSYRFTGTRMLSKREEVGLIVWLEAGYDYRGDLGKGLCVSAMFRLLSLLHLLFGLWRTSG